MDSQPIVESSDDDVFAPPNCVGLFRIGDHLLVARKQHRFPPVCLKTGRKTSETYEINDQFLTRNTTVIACILGGAIGYAIAKKRYGIPVKLRLPLDSNFKENKPGNSLFAWLGALIGLLMVIGGLLLAVIHWSGTVVLMLGFLFLIVTLILAFVKSQKSVPFTVDNVQPDFIWLLGVNRDVLLDFPDWNSRQRKR